MKILVSACLLGENCKYSGGNNLNPTIKKLIEGHEVILVCPEVLGGLPIPRVPCEIVNGKVISKEGRDCTNEYKLGALKALGIAKKEKVELAILQKRSPSCGVTSIYDGTFSSKLIAGEGIFVQELKKLGILIMEA